MKRIITADGSITFFNEKYRESYHHISGALDEALKKFAEPCKIRELAKRGNICILDICFGIGYNSGVAIDVIKKSNPRCKIRIVALENDTKILKEIGNLNPKIKNYGVIKELARNRTYNNNNINIKLIMGDARKTIKSIKERFDAVFLDPFSPKKNPELWTKQFFSEIKKRMKPNTILSTYTCARKVRDNMAKVGFKVISGPCIGRRAPITIVLNT